ncbi:hypothetical protein MC885_008137 [Smutsia gigantea]|nr:hypothetical protein MC885_008137 [Smutsia gigantea]
MYPEASTPVVAPSPPRRYETERGMRLAVEADIQGLRKVFSDLTLSKTDLEIQIAELNKDLELLKKEHQEELDSLRRQLGNTVSVEMDAAPGQNLSSIMNEMRQKYEALAQENLQKAKEQFEMQTQTLQQQVTVSTEELKGTEIQIKELRRTYMSLEIDLQSHLTVSLKLCVFQVKKTTEYQLSTLEERDVKKTRKIKTVVQEVVDGKVVSSEVKEVEESI